MELSEELRYRGFVAETTLSRTDAVDYHVSKKFYWGADPSADSLTIGNLAALMMCACFIRHGYEPYFLVGGATGQIGDPKDNGERSLKPLEEVEHNKACLKEQIERIIKNAAFSKYVPTVPLEEPDYPAYIAPSVMPTCEIHMLDNYEWFRDMKYLDFLREVGKAFSMTQLLDRQFVQKRIGEGGAGISYAEFSYTLIQGYDFLHLFRKYGVDLQLCGADQFGNCASGIHLIRRLEERSADVWSTPLVIDPVTGRKFGKSEGNAVWLAASDNGGGNFTSVFDFYQFWLNQPDEAVEYLLKIYTILPPHEINKILEEHKAAPEKRIAQKALARGATEVVHGEKVAKGVIDLSAMLFSPDNDFTEFDEYDLEKMSKFLPTVPMGTPLSEMLVNNNLAKSKKKAREFIEAGAISVNGAKVFIGAPIQQPAIVKKGKNKFIIVR